jgi:NMD protein affecting ribosome stability and mRNA decay
MWYCTACGKRNISDEVSRLCDKCDMKAGELKAKGERIPSLYCHSCGNKNRSESVGCERCSYNKSQSGDLAIERGNTKLLQKIDTLQHSIDKLQRMLPEDKMHLSDRDIESNRNLDIVRDMEPEKELPRSRHTTEEIKVKSDREPCPECNPEGDNSHKGKCKYCDGAGWWPCRKCGGEGVIKDSALGIFTDKLPACPKCHGGKWFACGLCDSAAADPGDGKVRPGNGLCRRCHGTGHL